jgi:transposase
MGLVPSCNRAQSNPSGLSAWLVQLTARTHRNVAAVALANELVRMAWAVLARNEVYRSPLLLRLDGPRR